MRTRTLVLAFVGTLLQPTPLLAQQPEPFLFNGQDRWDTTQVNAKHVRVIDGLLRLEGTQAGY